MKYRLLMLVLAAWLAIGLPGADAQNTAENLTDSCVQTYDANIDYFPEKVTVDAAEGFDVEYHNNYKVVTVKTPWQGAEKLLKYVLVQCGTPAPKDVTDATATINVPVKTIVAMSTSFFPHFVTQGVVDRLVAVDSILYTSTPDILKRFDDKKIVEIGGGSSGQDVNVEKLVDLNPDLVMTQRFDASDKSYPAIQEAGLPVVINADFLDTSPLGVAEWGKYISLYFNTEGKAEEAFKGVETRYHDLAKKVADAKEKPTVFAGTPYQGTWYMPGGKSYLATLIRDAGGAYLWADDTSTGSLSLSFENVYDKAADADYWVNVIFWNTLDDAKAADERFIDFKAYKQDNIYSNNARANGNGGSDYYESGYANPDVILADLATIFHPDMLQDHDLYYYKRLTPGKS
jgi:iron complex transport system substrate-binding protein